MLGGTLGPYRLDRELGAGGMGRVWAATVERDAPGGLSVGDRVAVKVVHPHLLESPDALARFEREVSIGVAVRHENVVRTYWGGALDGTHALVMEYVEGQTLAALRTELARVPEALCLHVAKEVAKGLAAIHGVGAVHRDLKPENVIITPTQVVKVMDLGVARSTDDALRVSHTGVFVGSLRYAAPEQFTGGGRGLDGRVDLHALGLVLYELATGTNPYDADDVPQTLRKVLHDTPRRLGAIDAQLSPLFEEMVHTLLAKKPEERFPDAAALIAVLDEGEASAWWRARGRALRDATKRPLRRIRIPRETEVYGRERELDRLRALFERAGAGDGQVVLVEGEAGIGKSRLVDELVARLLADGQDLNFLFGSYPPGRSASASGALATAFREQFGEAGAAAYLAQTPRLVPAFDALLRGDAAPPGAPALTKDAIGACFVHASRALAAERTTVVLIDDLHFAPDEARELFATVARAVPGHRLLLVGTMRPGVPEDWLAGVTRLEHTSRLELQRLGPRDLGRLLEDSLGSAHLAEQLALRIGQKSDGNPYFTFEIVRGLREGLFLARRADGTWATTRSIDEIEIPSSVRDLVNARLADLAQEERDLLDVAACWGFEFDPALVADAVGEPLLPTLKRFASIERAHRLVRAAGRRLVFDHHLVQKSIHGGLYPQIREAYHASLAEALERRSKAAEGAVDRLDGALCVDLCHHYVEGARGEAALRYLARAQRHLTERYLPAQVVRLTDALLAVPDLLRGSARASAALPMATALGRMGQSARHEECAREAERLAEAAGDEAMLGKALSSLALCFVGTSRFEAAEAANRRTIEIARRNGSKGAEAAGSANLGLVCSHLGRFAEGAEHCERAIVLARESGERKTEAGATVNLGIALLRTGRVAEARERFERGRTICREIGAMDFESVALGRLGELAANQGRLDEAMAAFEQQLALARESGDRAVEVAAHGNMGTVYQARGATSEAREQMGRELALAREIGDRASEARAIGNLGVVALSQGEFAAARDLHERMLGIARATGNRMSEGWGLLDLGLALHSLGENRAAREAFESSAELCRAIGARDYEARGLLSQARLAADGDDFETAARLTLEALALHRGIDDRRGTCESLLQLGELRGPTDAEAARSALQEAVEIAHELGDAGRETHGRTLLACLPGADAAAAPSAPAPNAGVPDALQFFHLRWKATRDRAHLTAAKRALDELLAKNPPEARESMTRHVRLNREVLAACRAEGVA